MMSTPFHCPFTITLTHTHTHTHTHTVSALTLAALAATLPQALDRVERALQPLWQGPSCQGLRTGKAEAKAAAQCAAGAQPALLLPLLRVRGGAVYGEGGDRRPHRSLISRGTSLIPLTVVYFHIHTQGQRGGQPPSVF